MGGFTTLRRAVRRIKHGFGARVIILLYHRIASLESDPHLLCVTPEHFAQHLELLRSRCQVVSLKHLAQALQEGNLPRRAVVLTFDDGYADNLYNAKRLLQQYEMPATVFVATGYVGHEQEFWWDELERLILRPGDLPETLRLGVDGSAGHWQLGKAAHYSEEAYRLHRSWNVEREAPGPRQRLFQDLYQVLFPLTPEGRQQALDQLRQWAGADRLCRLTHRMLASGELVDLARGGLVELGAHTVTHSVLSAFPATTQREEIRISKAHLEQVLGHLVTSFSYPFGMLSTYTDETITAVREAGFACACSNFPELVRRSVDPFQLPRFVVRDWDGGTFARFLEYWLGV